MTNKKTFLQTATLIEDILGVKKVGYCFLDIIWMAQYRRDSCFFEELLRVVL